jgi:hypothetical protein
MTENTNSMAADPSAQQPQQREDSFGYEWIANLLSVLDTNLSSEARAAVLRKCATVHFSAASMNPGKEFTDEI